LCSHGLLSENDFPWAFIERLEDLLHLGDLILRSHKHVVVLHIVLESVGLAIILRFVDEDTESSWHSSSDFLSCFGQQMCFSISQEFCHCTFNCIGFDVLLELFIILLIITTSCSASLSSNCFSFKQIVEILYKIWSRSWVSNEYNFSSGVNNSYMWNSLYSEFFVGNTLSISDVVVLDACPLLVLNMVLDFLSSLIN